MKTLAFLISFFCALSLNVMAEQSVTIDTLVIFNGETIKGISEGYGAPFEIIANPDMTGINKTDSVLQVGRTTINWWEYFNVTIDTTLWGTDCFFEMMINYPAQPNIAFRPDAYYRSEPSELYDITGLNTWQIVRFDASASIGKLFTTMRLYPDLDQMVLSSTVFGYIDEIKLITKTITIPESIDKELCNFESSETAVPGFGAACERILNPQNDSNNDSDSCLQIGRTGTQWYELIDIAIEEFYVPTSDVCYLHMKVKSSDTLDISLRPNESGEIRANNPYTGGDQWQDLVFDITASQAPGSKITTIRLLTDVQLKLNNTDNFAYFDEIIVNEDSMPRINISTKIIETKDTEVSIYPNPTSEQFFINGEGVSSAVIYNVSGQEVLRTNSIASGIDMSSLCDGFYLVKCNDDQDNSIAIKRVVKK